MKSTLAIVCAILIGGPAAADDIVLKYKGRLYDPKGWVGEGRDKRQLNDTIEIAFSATISDREVTLQADPNYDFRGTPPASTLKFVIRKLDDQGHLLFRSRERVTRRHGEQPLIVGSLEPWVALITLSWAEDETRALKGVIADCRRLIGTLSTTPPQVT